MGNGESKTVNYVLFGKREELTQFPETEPVVVATGENEKTQFRPIYLFWDKTDEMLVQYYEKKGVSSFWGKGLSSLAKRHMQNKYNEVFLCNPETLFLSERAEKEIPRGLWREEPSSQGDLFRGFGKEMAIKLLEHTQRETTVFYMLDEDCRYEDVQMWLLAAEEAVNISMGNLFLFGSREQKESSEDVLEQFYMETGLAGSFYPVSECKRILSGAKGDVLLLDCYGLAVSELGRPTFYIDGAGVRTEKEIRRLRGVCKACHSLRNHLDRAFLSAL